jgi:hypothetical protein
MIFYFEGRVLHVPLEKKAGTAALDSEGTVLLKAALQRRGPAVAWKISRKRRKAGMQGI